MNEKTRTGVSSEKEKVKESQSRSVTPSLDTPSGDGWGRHNFSKGLSFVTPTRDLDKYQSDRSSSRCPLGDLNNYKSETSISISLIYMSFGRSE